MVKPYLEGSILGRAKKAGVKLAAHDLRAFATDKHSTTDDTPYGGGPGMIMLVEPMHRAVKKLCARLFPSRTRVVLTAAAGKPFTQADARRLAKYRQVIFLCGRYEGVDHRVAEHVADETLSIGPYVLTGGELPALVMADAIVRLQPGVLGNEETLADESFDTEGAGEYPQYSKPVEYNGWEVPEVLLSGNHKRIREWRDAHRRRVDP
jgi:tRNA (guanine37-N1)-methyltransferase